MPKMMSQCAVKDYARWRPVFDGFAPKRAEFGVSNPRVYRNTLDPNDLMIVTDVADPSKARAMMASDELRRAMQQAGVIGAPTVHLVD